MSFFLKALQLLEHIRCSGDWSHVMTYNALVCTVPMKYKSCGKNLGNKCLQCLGLYCTHEIICWIGNLQESSKNLGKFLEISKKFQESWNLEDSWKLPINFQESWKITFSRILEDSWKFPINFQESWKILGHFQHYIYI